MSFSFAIRSIEVSNNDYDYNCGDDDADYKDVYLSCYESRVTHTRAALVVARINYFNSLISNDNTKQGPINEKKQNATTYSDYRALSSSTMHPRFY